MSPTVVSSAPRVKRALVQRLRDDPALSGVQVSHGHPYPEKPEGALIEVRRSRPADPVGVMPGGHTQAAHGSRGEREERYTIDVVVTVQATPRNRYPDMEEQAYAIASLVDANVRAWQQTTPAAFDGVARWVLVSSTEDDEALDNDAREASVLVTLAVAARI